MFFYSTIHICVCVCVCMCVSACMYVCDYARMCVCTYTCLYGKFSLWEQYLINTYLTFILLVNNWNYCCNHTSDVM